MTRTGWAGAALCLLALAACAGAKAQPGGPPPAASQARESMMQGTIAGRVELDGAPLAGVTVALVGGGEAPVASVATDEQGCFVLGPAPAVGEAWVLARLRQPFLGVLAARVPAGGAPLVLAASARSAHTLSVSLQLPVNLPFDQGELELDPEALPGVPASVLRAAVAVGGDDPARLAYRRVHLSTPATSVRLLGGTWRVEAHRELDGPTLLPFAKGPRNWRSHDLRLPGGRTVPRKDGGHRVELQADLAVTIDCQPIRP